MNGDNANVANGLDAAGATSQADETVKSSGAEQAGTGAPGADYLAGSGATQDLPASQAALGSSDGGVLQSADKLTDREVARIETAIKLSDEQEAAKILASTKQIPHVEQAESGALAEGGGNSASPAAATMLQAAEVEQLAGSDEPLPAGVSKVMAKRLGPDGWRDTEVHIFHMKDGTSREITPEERASLTPPAWWGDTILALDDANRQGGFGSLA